MDLKNIGIYMHNDFQISLTNDGWKPDEIKIFRQFNWRCILCDRKAAVLHEIIPKSKAPKTWKKPGNRVPLCVSCHDDVTRQSAAASRPRLERSRDEKLELYGQRFD
jgi:5-methylcytosine-specific restriction endonuclease McrA